MAVERAVSPQRFRHIVAVAGLAVALARAHGVDAIQMRYAALLYDYAREWDFARLEAEAASYGLPLTRFDRLDPGMLHGPVAAAIAAREFGLDARACAAISVHTTGSPGMDTFALVLYVADHAAEGRSGARVEHWRHRAHKDLMAVAREIMDQAVIDAIMHGWLIPPLLIDARNDLVQRIAAVTAQRRASAIPEGATSSEMPPENLG